MGPAARPPGSNPASAERRADVLDGAAAVGHGPAAVGAEVDGEAAAAEDEERRPTGVALTEADRQAAAQQREPRRAVGNESISAVPVRSRTTEAPVS
jgi:hypothetical protein